MTTTLAKNHTTVSDGWSRDEDGVLRIPLLKAFQLFGALNHDRGHAPAYALNLECSRGMSFTDFTDVNDIECLGGI